MVVEEEEKKRRRRRRRRRESRSEEEEEGEEEPKKRARRSATRPFFCSFFCYFCREPGAAAPSFFLPISYSPSVSRRRNSP